MLFDSLSYFFSNKIFSSFPQAIIFSKNKIRFGNKKLSIKPFFENSNEENIFILSGTEEELIIKNNYQNSNLNIFVLPIFESFDEDIEFPFDENLDINFKVIFIATTINQRPNAIRL